MIDRADGGGLRVLSRASNGEAVVDWVGAIPSGVLAKEWRLFAEYGALKLGIDCCAGGNDMAASGCPGPIKFDEGRAEATRRSKTWLMVWRDCLRSLIAIAFGLSLGCRWSSGCGSSGIESNSQNESRIGEHAGEEPTDVTMVRWPDDMYDRRLVLSLRASSCLPSWEMKLAVELSSKDRSRAARSS